MSDGSQFPAELPIKVVHTILPPDAIVFTDQLQRAAYERLWPWFWFACDFPDRPIDEACIFQGGCGWCDEEKVHKGAVRYARRCGACGMTDAATPRGRDGEILCHQHVLGAAPLALPPVPGWAPRMR